MAGDRTIASFFSEKAGEIRCFVGSPLKGESSGTAGGEVFPFKGSRVAPTKKRTCPFSRKKILPAAARRGARRKIPARGKKTL